MIVFLSEELYLTIPEVTIPIPGVEEIQVGRDVEEILDKEQWVESDVIDVSLDAEGARALLIRTGVIYIYKIYFIFYTILNLLLWSQSPDM